MITLGAAAKIFGGHGKFRSSPPFPLRQKCAWRYSDGKAASRSSFTANLRSSSALPAGELDVGQRCWVIGRTTGAANPTCVSGLTESLA